MPLHVENLLAQGKPLIQKLYNETCRRDLAPAWSEAFSQEQICTA